MTRPLLRLTPALLLLALSLVGRPAVAADAPADAAAEAADEAAADEAVEAEPQSKDEAEADEAATADLEIPGGDPVVNEALARVDADVRACFEKAVEAGRRPTGEISLSWNVAESGVFEAVTVDQSTLEDPEVEACITEVVEGIVVEPRSQPIPASYTWAFDIDSGKLAVYGKQAKRWSVAASFGTRAGAMMFHPTRFVRSNNASVVTSLSVQASWRFDERLIGTVGLGGSYELTTPNNLEGRRFWGSDPTFGVSIPQLYMEEVTGIRVSGSVSGSVGLSDMSRWQTQLGSLGAGLNASRSFQQGRLTVSFGLSGRSYFHRYTSPVGEPVADDGVELLIARTGGAEDLGDLVAIAGANPAASAGAMLSAHWQLTDRVGANIGMQLGRVWSHTPALDGLSSDVTDINGDPVVDCGGWCPNDMMTGVIGANWRFKDRWSLSGNLATGGAVFANRRVDPQAQDGSELSEDSRYFRFPFWDPNLSGSSFSLSVSRTF